MSSQIYSMEETCLKDMFSAMDMGKSFIAWRMKCVDDVKSDAVTALRITGVGKLLGSRAGWAPKELAAGRTGVD